MPAAPAGAGTSGATLDGGETTPLRGGGEITLFAGGGETTPFFEGGAIANPNVGGDTAGGGDDGFAGESPSKSIIAPVCTAGVTFVPTGRNPGGGARICGRGDGGAGQRFPALGLAASTRLSIAAFECLRGVCVCERRGAR